MIKVIVQGCNKWNRKNIGSNDNALDASHCVATTRHGAIHQSSHWRDDHSCANRVPYVLHWWDHAFRGAYARGCRSIGCGDRSGFSCGWDQPEWLRNTFESRLGWSSKSWEHVGWHTFDQPFLLLEIGGFVQIWVGWYLGFWVSDDTNKNKSKLTTSHQREHHRQHFFQNSLGFSKHHTTMVLSFTSTTTDTHTNNNVTLLRLVSQAVCLVRPCGTIAGDNVGTLTVFPSAYAQ